MTIRWLESQNTDYYGDHTYQWLAAKGDCLLIVRTLGNDPECQSEFRVIIGDFQHSGTCWTAKDAREVAEDRARLWVDKGSK